MIQKGLQVEYCFKIECEINFIYLGCNLFQHAKGTKQVNISPQLYQYKQQHFDIKS